MSYKLLRMRFFIINRARPVYKIYRGNENNRNDEILLKHSLWGRHQRRKSAQVILNH